ncbi:MAG TPA: FAD-linked oxidase C-terminal domain-containing protein [Actinoplanes sp.]
MRGRGPAERRCDGLGQVGGGGTVTGEHGVGVLKRAWLERELGPAGHDLQKRIKELFDPYGILNPGKAL